jgi:trigger factor
MDRMQTQVEELPENRVRLTVQVPSHDVHHAVEHAADDLSQSVKVPGFRKGKVPRQVLLQRVGRERLMTEAVESHIGGWFWNAAARTRLRPVAQPEYDFVLPDSADEDWEFTATVAVQAKPELPDWTQLEVGVADVEVPEELVQAELDALRATVAELVPVEGRPVAPDDTVILDLVAADETRHDYVVELGRGAVVEEIERSLVGMTAGETKEISFELADGSTQSVTATVKEIKEKMLPPLDDDLARSASEFETLAELRADIESRLHEQIEDEVETRFRSDVADALVGASKFEAAGPLVEARTRELLNGFARQVESRGVQPAAGGARGAPPRRGAAVGRARARPRRRRRPARARGSGRPGRGARARAGRGARRRCRPDAREPPRQRPLRDAARRPAARRGA